MKHRHLTSISTVVAEIGQRAEYGLTALLFDYRLGFFYLFIVSNDLGALSLAAVISKLTSVINTNKEPDR